MTELDAFAARYPFPLDPFQLTACTSLEAGDGVLVAAPTGAGKTVVGEFAVHLALARGQKCFYTTPIKALSNQKYGDLLARHGPANVGLLTGDNAVNGDAPVVVMTTEVLRNMLYARSGALRGLGYVVMDEVHYLSDRYRGAVWEEVIIHLPQSVRLVSLSATVSNAEEFAEWLVTVRGHTKVVVEEHRPVPLWQHILAGSRLFDLFVESDAGRPEVNPAVVRLAREERVVADWGATRRPHRGGHRPRSGTPLPSRVDVVEKLDREGLLPAITFIFSRAGCEAAVQQCLRAGLRLNSQEERERVREYVELRCADLPEEDLAVLAYWEWLDGLERGVAAHHAGMIPTFKECVEELFVRGLVKAVFATETLALGINMPARSVVLERLVKWNGETHADITPGEYTQLTGRAGRRGIDVEGHAVVLWQPGLDPLAVAGLASTRTYPLRSSFRPSYNMAVNLVGSVGREKARALLEQSFAQFQADKAVVGLARQVARNDEALTGYESSMDCHLGDFGEYADLRGELKKREAALARDSAAQRRLAAVRSLEQLRPGDVVRVPAGRRAGLAVVLDPGLSTEDDPRPYVLLEDKQVRRLSTVEFPTEVEAIGHVKVPRNFNPRSPQARRDLASSLRALGLPSNGERPRRGRSAAADDETLARLRKELRNHPCHGCAEREDHARWAERCDKLRRDTDVLREKVRGRTGSIARTFDRVVALLESLGYVSGDAVTATGRMLQQVYNESDLLVVECLRSGLWDGLTPPELAACVSVLVYESRGPGETAPKIPGGAVRDTLAEMVRVWARLKEAEEDQHLDFLREPDPGFAWAAHRWAAGARLEAVLTESDLTAGDFVRWAKMLLDLLSQVADVAAENSPVRSTARTALGALRRGVVAYSSVV
ncbi:MAG: ATP-dependent helicase HelY [Frankiaceae bacterium]|jgi:ATP-dependent RNA helicase HelY|nr:ATP-dependent helicase HelY [Frankiaceae bacterium]